MCDIILTGPKHSGKTSAGKILASLYSCDFIDLDELVLQKTGKTPRQLYNEDAAWFQKAEAEALAATCRADRTEGQRVIAVGGGIIDNLKAVDILKKMKAKIVYLNISAATAWDRIAKEDLPPFLQTGSPQETHRILHERRAAAYSLLANITINVEDKPPDKIADEIFSRVFP